MKSHLIITGTHLTPALAIIDKLKSSHQLTYVGNPHLKLSIPVKQFTAPKLHRHNLTSAATLPFKLPIAILKASQLLKPLKPDLILSFGGYVSLPICLAAILKKIPIVIHEQTFGAGLVNKLTSKLATKIAISWPDSKIYFPNQKTVLTGNPIRKELINLISKHTQPPTIYITGGNQGSQILNQTVSLVLPELLKKYQVVHQFGLNQKKSLWLTQLAFKKALPQNLSKNYILEEWFSVRALASIYQKTSLVISRSGANTITELGYLNKKAILIPLPYAQKNEQLINAQYLEKLGLAITLPQKDLTPQSLLKTIIKVQALPAKSDLTFPHSLVKSASSNLVKLVNGVLSDT